MPMFRWFEQFLRDVGFGVRNLLKSPGFAAVAVLSLGMGIMATTAIYSVVYAVILDPFPYKDVDTLMSVAVRDPGQHGYRTGYTPDQFLEIAERNTIFSATLASTISDVLWIGADEPQRLRGNFVTTNTFPVLGVPPLLGRWITEADGHPDAPAVAVLGYRFWQRQFGGDPAVLGRQLRLNDQVRTVVGVMPKRFMWRGADVYLPVVFRRGQAVEGIRYVHLLGRLKAGVTEAQAEAGLRPIIEDLGKREPGQFPEKFRVGLLSFKETFPSAIREGLWVLLGAVGLLLLIACANVSNLLLSKAAARQREMAVRAALGADRWRLIRQLLTESLVLALVGGALGVGLAFGALKGIIALVPPGTIPDESEIVINTPVLLFTLGLSAATAILFGLAPALHTCTRDLADPLKASGRSLSGGFGQAVLRNGLVVVEVALSLVLLAAASLMLRALMERENVNIGFPSDRVLVMTVPLADNRYPDPARRVAFYEELLRRLGTVPGVVAAAVNTGLHPLGDWQLPVEVAGSGQQDTRPVLVHQVSPGYTSVVGVGLTQGRSFSESEVAGRQHLAMVNQAFLRRLIPEGSGLGRMVRIPRLKSAPANLQDDSFQIVGVVRDSVNRDLEKETVPEIYVPYTLTGMANLVAVRTQGDATSMANAVRAQVSGIDKNQPVMQLMSVERALDEWEYSTPRFNLALFSVFAGIGLALAVIGVYGVISNSVAQRTQEIGVRIALGASLASIAGMVLARGARLLAAGIALGLLGSGLAVRLLASRIPDFPRFDPWSFGAVSLILLAAGLQACYWPARRAARVDPVAALRYE